MEFIYTDGSDERFIRLCMELDDALNEIVGGEKQREQYNEYNTLENIHDVLLVLHEGIPIACGSFKRYRDEVAELKRVFVRATYRKNGLGKEIIKKLVERAKIKGYKKLILETGKPMKSAISLYRSMDFYEINNYGPYKNMTESICMEKIL